MESNVRKASVILIMPLFFQLLANNHCQGFFLANYTSNLLLLTTYLYRFMKFIWEKVGHKQLCCSPTRLTSFDFNRNLLEKVSKYIYFYHMLLFFNRHVSLFIKHPFIKPSVDVFAIFF